MFWVQRRHGSTLPVDETWFVPVPGGWEIALHHILPQGTPRTIPVVLAHGLVMNRRCFDATPDTSLARYLAARGHDVWIPEYRGGGDSRFVGASGQSRWRFDFDTLVSEDMPAILAAVCSRSGSTQVSWVGHSMGGLLAYAYASLRGCDQLHRLITLGSPASFPSGGVMWVPALGRHALSRLSLFHTDWWTLLGLPLMMLSQRWMKVFVNPAVATPGEILALMAGGVQRTSTPLLLQFEGWQRSGHLTRSDGNGSWDEAPASLTVPFLAIAGRSDRLAPPRAVASAWHQATLAPRALRVFGDAPGEPSFGHLDLIHSAAARIYVFPEIAAWLEADAPGEVPS